MDNPTYITVKIFTWIMGILVTIFCLGMTGATSSLSEKVNSNSEDIKKNNTLIYQHQLVIVESLGDIKSSISELK